MANVTPDARAYAQAHIANVLGLHGRDAVADEQLLALVFRELSRTVEVETSLRDQWGNWEFPFGESNLRGQLYVPWLDQRLVALRDALRAQHPDLRPEPPWPEGHPFAVCLTHDVDFVTLNPSSSAAAREVMRNARLLLEGPRDRSAAPMITRGIVRGVYLLATLRSLRPKRERTYDEWLKLEDRFGFKSTFFYFPEKVSVPHVYDCLYSFDDPVGYDGRRMRVRDMMVEMDRAGWEIGLHGSYHSALRAGLLAHQRQQVEDAIGHRVLSTRQHWLHYDARVTPALQAQADLRADSTQGFNRNVGFRAGTAFPYACWDFDLSQALPVMEIPQHVMDGALFTPNALEYDADRAIRHCVKLMDEVEAVGGCLTLSWHPNSIQVPPYWAVYESVLAEAARRRAWGCSVGELHRWWTDRAARIAARQQPTPRV
ncbi:MAG TPA: polysaccharide deacetylase family protein [Candidatus Eisenbacteria bacterium]